MAAISAGNAGMNAVRLMMGAAAAAVSSLGLGASAQANQPAYTGNVSLATDYAFRGISQTHAAAAVQGGLDMAIDNFYAGAWASNVDFTEFGVSGGLELDLYAGIKAPLDAVTLDFGIIGYFYPNSSDIPGPTPSVEGELDYAEVYAKAGFVLAENIGVTLSAFLSPEFTGETGQASYLEAAGTIAATDTLSFSGAVGYQTIDDVSGVFAGTVSDEYLTWTIGGTLTLEGFAVDLRYIDADIKNSDPIIAQAFTTFDRVDGRVILGVKRSF
jgi:uncharacterized protein (TIGR02001 family)